MGRFKDRAYYCITDFVKGKTSNVLSEEEIAKALPSIQKTLAATFTADISFSTGYGNVDAASGNAPSDSWHDHLLAVEKRGKDAFKANAHNIGLPADLIDAFFEQYRANITFASEVRRLLHGDPAFDNMLIDNDTVAAVIDWGQLGYGDWMSDFARLGFWRSGRYGDKQKFAHAHGLEADHLDDREALYWAANALWTIEFADKAKNEKVTQWLHEHVQRKLLI